MSSALAPALQGSGGSDRLPELSRLAAHLASNVLESQIEGRPVPDDHIRFLLDAALLLQEHGVVLPSLLGQIMKGAAEPEAAPPSNPPRTRPASEDDDDAGRLAWLLRPFQAMKG
ncbi:hypothetical protein [Methylobacterium sp.]|jgi:hypothetical protein|uniref:hypothetical protein n=1 Tax=Methylobacterium sp. TaxID=409 RepID=UPI002620E885|nr:hypothetical protein [Methylobacterium sp.]MDB5645839.1 hypothetical protein [Methylobacterium sp.]